MLTLEPLEDGERGAIVNTSSIAALEGEAGQVAYSASKAGIIGMTLPLARDFRSEGIRVNTILPGSFDTPLLSTAPPDIYQRLIDAVPFPHRLGKPREFASLVLEICRNPYFNGEFVRLDGAVRL
jgi:NAD(P)-dependent dehydrogenase (short-subunit alcohol dehydrogenase family)